MGEPEDGAQQSAPDDEQKDEGTQSPQPDPEPSTPPDDGGIQPDHTYEV